MTSQDGTSAGPDVDPRGDADGSETSSANAAEGGAAETIAFVIEELGRVQEQLAQLVRIEVDRLKIRWRERLFGVAWFVLGAIVLLTVTVAAVLYAMAGLAGFFAATLGRPVWLGNLVVGVFVLGVLALGLALVALVLRRRGLARLRESYERAVPSGDRKEPQR